MIFHTGVKTYHFFQLYKEVQKHLAKDEMVKLQNKFLILEELSLNVGFF